MKNILRFVSLIHILVPPIFAVFFFSSYSFCFPDRGVVWLPRPGCPTKFQETLASHSDGQVCKFRVAVAEPSLEENNENEIEDSGVLEQAFNVYLLLCVHVFSIRFGSQAVLLKSGPKCNLIYNINPKAHQRVQK